MEKVWCKKCKRGCCPVRQGHRHNGDIVIKYETITHEDGSKEQREYGSYNEKTNQILSLKII